MKIARLKLFLIGLVGEPLCETNAFRSTVANSRSPFRRGSFSLCSVVRSRLLSPPFGHSHLHTAVHLLSPPLGHSPSLSCSRSPCLLYCVLAPSLLMLTPRFSLSCSLILPLLCCIISLSLSSWSLPFSPSLALIPSCSPWWLLSPSPSLTYLCISVALDCLPRSHGQPTQGVFRIRRPRRSSLALRVPSGCPF